MYSKRFFTFGTSHISSNPDHPRNLADYWVEVTAADGHRNLFCDMFTSKYMGGPGKFAFEYTESEFDRSYCPSGLLLRIGEFIVPQRGEDPPEELIDWLADLTIEWEGDDEGIVFHNPNGIIVTVFPGEKFSWDGTMITKCLG